MSQVLLHLARDDAFLSWARVEDGQVERSDDFAALVTMELSLPIGL